MQPLLSVLGKWGQRGKPFPSLMKDLSVGLLESRKVLSHSPWGEPANSSSVCATLSLLPCDPANSPPERPGWSLGTPSYTEMLRQACDHRVTLDGIGVTSDARFPGCRGVKATTVSPWLGENSALCSEAVTSASKSGTCGSRQLSGPVL